MIRICLITYKKLDQLVQQAVASFSDPDVELYMVAGLRNELITRQASAMIERADIVIAGGANARIARENFRVPVIDYFITDYDYMTAIQSALRLGERVAVVTYMSAIDRRMLDFFQKEQTDGRLVNLIYEDTEDIYRLLEEHQTDVVVGAAHPVEVGEKLGKYTVLLYPGERSILETIHNAKQIAQELCRDRRQGQFMTGVMSLTSEGILLADADGNILRCNPAAEELCAVASGSLEGRQAAELSEELDIRDPTLRKQWEDWRRGRILGQELYIRTVSLENRRGSFDGAVIFLKRISELKSLVTEREKAYRGRKEKGFHARKTFQDLIGSSDILASCVEEARFFSDSDSSIILLGETGVGKEIFAQSIHNHSRRKHENFIGINCAALPENLLEAELFGYDEGAFTGGRRGGKPGLFEMANNGTIFLDEIGEISPNVQARLLRVLQEREIMHVGGDRIIPINVRIISATNRNLQELPDDKFRKDLLYRLGVLEVTIPPLREREGDVAELFEHFYRKSQNAKFPHLKLPDEVRYILMRYSWPGNIRELQNVCERFGIYLKMTDKPTPQSLRRCIVKAIGEKKLLGCILSLYKYKQEGSSADPNLILELKKIFSYNREQIAELLCVSRTTVWRMTKELEKTKASESQGPPIMPELPAKRQRNIVENQ